mgnify:FL=1
MTEEMAPYNVTPLPAGQKRGRPKAGPKFVQIAASGEGDLFALDNQGRVWEAYRSEAARDEDESLRWEPLPPHPEAAP